MQHAQRRQGTLALPPRRPAQPKRWSHQDDLLTMRHKLVRIQFRDGQGLDATLLEADPFAVKIRADGYQSSLIVWKHDLCSITLAPVGAE